MPKAHIQTPDGAKITIEGEVTEIAAIVNQIQSSTASVRNRKVTKAIRQQRDQKKRESASTRVVNLKEEGFFDAPKSLAAVVTELEKSGYLYPVTSLSGVMLGLVQKRLLTRIKKDGVWVYGKR